MGTVVRLRPVAEEELGELLRLLWDPDAPGDYQWFGYRIATVKQLEDAGGTRTA